MRLRTFQQNLSLLLTLLTAAFCLSPKNVLAADHVVTSSELRERLLSATQARQANLATMRDFFAAEPARKAMASAAISASQVERALPLLSNEELARISTLAAKTQAEFQGGALTNQQLTYIIIALATAVIVLLIVAKK